MTVLRERPLRAPEIPAFTTWRISGFYATLTSMGRGRLHTEVWVANRICPHGGSWVDEKASDPRVRHAWGIDLHAPCESKRCARLYREHNR